MVGLRIFYGLFTCISAFAFVLDVYGFFNGRSAYIAELAQTKGVVRRLTHRNFSWDQLMMGSRLSPMDTISTAANSWAEIIFMNGGRLELSEGTTVVLKQSPDSFVLEFVEGAGNVEIPRELIGKMTVEDKTVSDKKTSKVKVAITQLYGKKSKASAPELKPYRNVAASEMRNPLNQLSSIGLLNFNTLLASPILLFPEDGSVVKTQATLKWKPSRQSEKLSFWEIILLDSQNQEQVIKSTRPEVKVKLPNPGKYFWSVRGVAVDGTKSASSYFLSFENQVAARSRAPASANSDSDFRFKPAKIK